MSIDLKRRLEKLHQLRKKNQKKLNHTSLGRLLTFLVFISLLTTSYIYKDFIAILLLTSTIFFIWFIYFIRKFNKVELHQERLNLYIQFLKREIYRSENKISELYRDDPNQSEFNNNYTKDLDIFGSTGLYSYIDTTVTLNGNRLFLNQLLQVQINDSESIKNRQTVIKEIISHKLYLWKLVFLFQEASPTFGYSKIDIGFNLGKLRENLSFFSRLSSILKFYVPIIYSLILITFLMDKSGLWGIFFLIQFSLIIYRYKDKKNIIDKYYKFIKIFSKYKYLILYLYTTKYSSKDLKERFSIFKKDNLTHLFYLISKLENRLNYREIPLPGFLLNLFLCWDYLILSDIEKIERYTEVSITELISSLEWIDSLLPFCILSYYEQNLEFPEIFDEPTLSADKVGHPLIPSTNRVYNQILPMNCGNLMILTGSNMSGKTTYLRTIGLNLLLGLCGAPVFGKNMKISPLKILSSIKNEDSLSQGISFFYSEVRKLSYILKESKRNDSLVLIDEILKGTNTRERIIATKHIMKYLSKMNSFNYITTHDIELARESDSYILKHFTEIIENNKMGFDYLMRDGVITSGNALKILKIECSELEL